MAGGIEGERPPETDIPQPAGGPDQKQAPQQRGEGIRGVPPPQGEESQPQQERGERQPFPSVADILERRAQLREDRVRFRLGDEHKHNMRQRYAFYQEKREQVRQLGEEAASHYAEWPERDRLIFDLYTTSEDWRLGLSAQKTQAFMARVAPLLVEELAEELRKAKEVAERKAAIAKKISETRERQKGLSPEERERLRKERARAYYQANREKLLEYGHRYREMWRPWSGRDVPQRREEPQNLQAEKPQPTQVFPPPATK